MAKFCISCGKELVEGNAVCTQCGTPVSNNVNTNVAGTTSSNSNSGNVIALIGFIVSLVSLILCCGTLSWVSLILSIIGIVGAKKYDGKGKGLAIAGTIISAVGMILLIVVMFITPIWQWNTVTKDIDDKWNSINNDHSNNSYDYDDDYDDDYDFDDDYDYDFDYD